MLKKVAITTYINKGIVSILLISISQLWLIPAHSSNVTSQAPLTKKNPQRIVTDLRVLVDISGSMKKTDPKNLRRPALRLLAGLVPEGSRSGIWNFARQVNMTVKIGTVDDGWREAARAQSMEISSVGLFTNIESALRKVSFDWKEPDPRYKRNLILLTDGHVDVSQNEKADKDSRKRILNELLPAFEKAKVRIHTIALSDDVDEQLLSTLSSYTDGLHRKVSSADDLQKLFLQMLEQSTELDNLPIKDNRFNVDASINDMTLLVFNKDKTKPTTIVTPGKRTWSHKKHPQQVKWFSDDGYDLITVKKPQRGQWKIMAPLDESNRVVVATNLKLKINELPAFAMLGDVINVNAQLIEDEKPLADKRLLSKFNFSLKRKKSGTDEQLYPMSKLAGNESVYSIQLPPMFKPGESTFIVQAKSPTAEREIQHRLTVYNVPANVTIAEDKDSYKVTVTPHANILRPGSVKITSETEDKSKFVFVQHGKDWSFNVDKKYKNKLISIVINATRADGKPLMVNFNKVLAASGETQELVLEEKKEPPLKTAAGVKKDVKKTEPEKKEALIENKDKKENEINWTLIIMSIVVGNLLIVGVLGGGYFYLKRRKEKMAASLGDEMDEDSVSHDAGSK